MNTAPDPRGTVRLEVPGKKYADTTTIAINGSCLGSVSLMHIEYIIPLTSLVKPLCIYEC
jgi:hypothetical protein